MLVRSFIEVSLDMLIVALEGIVPLFFSLDQVHYSRWVPVFIHDLKTLSTRFPTLHRELASGYFAVNIRGNTFSKISLDHAQEHNNNKIKSTAGYIELVNQKNKEFLRKLELCLPEIDQYLSEIERPSTPQDHKEVSPTFIYKFMVDCRKVHVKILTNPFAHTHICRLNTTYLFPEVIVNYSEIVFTLGDKQYQEFRQKRFVDGSLDVIKSKITKNMLKLPKDANDVEIENLRILVSS